MQTAKKRLCPRQKKNHDNVRRAPTTNYCRLDNLHRRALKTSPQRPASVRGIVGICPSALTLLLRLSRVVLGRPHLRDAHVAVQARGRASDEVLRLQRSRERLHTGKHAAHVLPLGTHTKTQDTKDTRKKRSRNSTPQTKDRYRSSHQTTAQTVSERRRYSRVSNIRHTPRRTGYIKAKRNDTSGDGGRGIRKNTVRSGLLDSKMLSALLSPWVASRTRSSRPGCWGRPRTSANFVVCGESREKTTKYE